MLTEIASCYYGIVVWVREHALFSLEARLDYSGALAPCCRSIHPHGRHKEEAMNRFVARRVCDGGHLDSLVSRSRFFGCLRWTRQHNGFKGRVGWALEI